MRASRLRSVASKARCIFPSVENLLASSLRSPLPSGRGTVPAQPLRRPSSTTNPRRSGGKKESGEVPEKGAAGSFTLLLTTYPLLFFLRERRWTGDEIDHFAEARSVGIFYMQIRGAAKRRSRDSLDKGSVVDLAPPIAYSLPREKDPGEVLRT